MVDRGGCGRPAMVRVFAWLGDIEADAPSAAMAPFETWGLSWGGAGQGVSWVPTGSGGVLGGQWRPPVDHLYFGEGADDRPGGRASRMADVEGGPHPRGEVG